MTPVEDVPEQVLFLYREFWDFPRVLFLAIGERILLLSSAFDPVADDYPDVYRVYRMKPGFLPPEGSWESVELQADECLGTIPVRSVEFDASRRKYIKRDTLLPFLALL
jgi:hypothetical protein